MTHIHCVHNTRDLFVLLQILSMEADSLIEEQPSNASLIADKQNEIIDHWEELMEKADQRKQKLEESRQFQRFLCDHRDLVCVRITYIYYSCVHIYANILYHINSCLPPHSVTHYSCTCMLTLLDLLSF